jgi:4-coumarate--CoA ligase
MLPYKNPSDYSWDSSPNFPSSLLSCSSVNLILVLISTHLLLNFLTALLNRSTTIIMSAPQAVQEFVSPNGIVPHIPSNMTVAQFFLDYRHPNRPVRTENSPWLIDNDTGRSYPLEEIRTRTYALANVMKARWDIGNNDCVAFFTPNHVEFPITAWAAHRLGAIAAAANPAFSVDELVYQLNTIKAKLLVVHHSIFATGLEAAKLAGLSEDRVVVIPNRDEPAPEGYQTLDELADEGNRLYPEPFFNESFLAEDEAKTKIAVSVPLAKHSHVH